MYNKNILIKYLCIWWVCAGYEFVCESILPRKQRIFVQFYIKRLCKVEYFNLFRLDELKRIRF